MAAACKAVCVVVSETGNNVLGHLNLTQSDANHPVQITGNLTGLTPGKHGLSICISGDLSQGAASCGAIFNPFGTSFVLDKRSVSGDLLQKVLSLTLARCAVFCYADHSQKL